MEASEFIPWLTGECLREPPGRPLSEVIADLREEGYEQQAAELEASGVPLDSTVTVDSFKIRGGGSTNEPLQLALEQIGKEEEIAPASLKPSRRRSIQYNPMRIFAAGIAASSGPVFGKATLKTPKRTQTRFYRAEEPPQTGRNQPCPCGSGKKYKACCRSKK